MNKLVFLTSCLLCLIGAALVSAQDSVIGEAQPLETPPTAIPPTDAPLRDYDDDDEDDDDVDDEWDGEGMPPARPGEQVINSVKWSAPNLSDEEAHSTRLPGNLICDGCTGIAHQIGLIVGTFHKQKYEHKGKLAPESEVIELFEKVCDRKTFEGYGLKLYNEENRLSGPGTEAEAEPGMMQGGGRWPYRLYMMCNEIVGEVDEYDLYQYIVENGIDELQAFLCENPIERELNSCGEVKSATHNKEEL